MRPTSILICGQPFDVVGVPLGELIHKLEPGDPPSSDPMQAFGCTSVHQQRIAIRDEQAPLSERDTVLHEVMHAIVRMTSMDGSFNDYSDQEAAINALSVGLLAVLRQNPALTVWLAGLPDVTVQS